MNGTRGNHVAVLDGLRGVAILLVMFHHCTILAPKSSPEKLLVNVSGIGPHGVDLFFVLSGFLITGILLDTKDQRGYFQKFYMRRALRIFPLYYGVLVICILILPTLAAGIPAASAKLGRLVTAPGDWPWYVGYASNFLVANTKSWRHPVLGVTWSLAIEEQFYLFWAVIVFFVSQPKLKTLALWLAGMSLAFRCAMWLAGYAWIQIYVLTWCRMDGLALGALIAVSIRGSKWNPVHLMPVMRKLAFFLTSLLLLAYAGGWMHYDTAMGTTFGYFAVSLTCAAWVYLALYAGAASTLHKTLSSKTLCFFGKYSYAIYLFHLPIRAGLRDTVFASSHVTAVIGDGIIWQLAFYSASTLAVIPCALLSWKLLEYPILCLKERIAPYGQTDAPLVGVAAIV